MKKEFAPIPSRFPFAAVMLLVFAVLIPPAMTAGQVPQNSVLAAETLVSTQITLSVDEQALGELLPQLLLKAGGRVPSDRGHLPPIRSLWLDRQADTGASVSLTEAATPAAAVILKIAEMNNLAVFPLPGVLVLGRPDWVDSTVSQLPHLEQSSDDLISIRWPTGSTAAEVLELILAAPARRQGDPTVTDMAAVVTTDSQTTSSHENRTWIPHDIWASGSLTAVDRTLAVALFLAQFDCALKTGTSLELLGNRPSAARTADGASILAAPPEGVLGWAAMPPEDPFLLVYPAGESALSIRTVLAQTHPRATVRVSNKQLLISTTAKNHRHAIAIHWHASTGKPRRAAVAGDLPATVFDLQLIDKPAVEVLKQLAQAAGKKFRVVEGAESAAESLVTLDAKETTLQDLAQLVAEKAGLNVRWEETEVVLSTPQVR